MFKTKFLYPLSFLFQVMESHDKGAKLTAADSYGWTPLHHAARLGKKDVVRYLVDSSKLCSSGQ